MFFDLNFKIENSDKIYEEIMYRLVNKTEYKREFKYAEIILDKFYIETLNRLEEIMKNNGCTINDCKLFGKNYVIMPNSKLLTLWGLKFTEVKTTKNNNIQYYSLRINNERRMISVARVVALSYLPNPNKYMYISYKDGDKRNNSIENLEWSPTMMLEDTNTQIPMESRTEFTVEDISRLKDIISDIVDSKNYTSYSRKLYDSLEEFKEIKKKIIFMNISKCVESIGVNLEDCKIISGYYILTPNNECISIRFGKVIKKISYETTKCYKLTLDKMRVVSCSKLYNYVFKGDSDID